MVPELHHVAALALTHALPHVPAAAVALAVAGAGIVVAVFALAPCLVALVRATRPLSAGVRADLNVPADADLRVVESETVDAFAAGVLPGAERVYVTDTLVAASSRDELRAVVAHEMGHVEAGHARQRCALLAGVAAGTALVGPGFGATGLAVAGFAVGVAGLAWLGRRQERAADEFAVRRAGADASRRALGRLDRAAAGPLRWLCTRLGVRTPTGRRADRLEK